MSEFHKSYDTNLTELQRLKIELAKVRKRNQQLEEESVKNSWILNPDRAGGCFTQQEINDANAWR